MSDQPEKTALARRVMAAPGFRPLPGMRFARPDGSHPIRMVATDCYAHEGESGHRIQAATGLFHGDVVDLDDEVTAAAIMAMDIATVRTRHPRAFALPPGALSARWGIIPSANSSPLDWSIAEGDTEAAAWAAAAGVVTL